MSVAYNSSGLRIELHGKLRCKHLKTMVQEFGRFYDGLVGIVGSDAVTAHEIMQAVVSSFTSASFSVCEETFDNADADADADADESGGATTAEDGPIEVDVEFTPAFDLDEDEDDTEEEDD